MTDIVQITEKIIEYESGSMTDEEAIEFFQMIIDTGIVWELQGSYGRTAKELIQGNLCTIKE